MWVERVCAGALVAGALVIGAGSMAHGQDVGTPTTMPADDAAWKAKMEKRVGDLEQENAELRAQKQVPPGTAGPGIFVARPGQVTPPEFDVKKYVAEGSFPGSITIPGTNVSLQVGGFAQIDVITDNHQIGSKNSFIVSSIPTGDPGAGQTNFSVKQTRLFVKSETPTSWGPFVTYVEGDFFSSDGTNLRLRHAYGQIGDKHQFLAGQTWTTFMDASVYPAIFDYQGPNSMVLVRQPLLRYTEKVCDELEWRVAIEDPNPDISHATNVSGSGTAQWPDFAANVRWMPGWGHMQLSGILRELQFDPASGHRSTALGWGLNLTGAVNVLKPVAQGKQDNIMFQIAGGEGIANYINDTNGIALDGFVKANGDLEALGTVGGYVAYQHYWCAEWASTVGYSYLHMYPVTGQSPSAYKAGHYAVANIMYYPTDRIWVGIEALYGVRNDVNGNKGDDGRLSFSVQYRF